MNRQVGDGCSPDVAYAKKKGNALLSYLPDCVRRGNYSDIEAALSDPAYLDEVILILRGISAVMSCSHSTGKL